MTNVPIAVDEEGACWGKQIPQQLDPGRHDAEIRIQAIAPSVSVELLFDDRLFLCRFLVGRVADRSRSGEVRSGRKRRIDVDEVDLASELLQQRRHDEEVVAPDQL